MTIPEHIGRLAAFVMSLMMMVVAAPALGTGSAAHRLAGNDPILLGHARLPARAAHTGAHG